MHRLLAFVLAVAGCGFRASVSDAGAPGDGEPDAAASDAAVVDAAPLGPFGPPQRIDPLSSGSADDDPTLTADRLEIYFNSSRTGGPGNGDIWFATRSAPTAAWDAPQLLAAASTSASESTPEITADGLTLHFASDRVGGAGGSDIWVITRSTRASAWSAAMPVAELNSTSADGSAAVEPGGRIVVLSSTRPGTGDRDIYLATRASSSGTWSAPEEVSHNTTVYDASPFLARGGRALYFSSLRSPSAGGEDIWYAERSSTTEPFGAPVRVTELATGTNEADPWLTDDERYMVFARGGELYETSR